MSIEIINSPNIIPDLSVEDVEDLMDIVSEIKRLSEKGLIEVDLPNAINETNRLEQLLQTLNQLRYP